MSNIDWSKAPHGAVCAMVANFSSSAVKPGDVEFPDSEYVAESYAVGPNSWTRVERPTAWDGSGLPPVGVECELMRRGSTQPWQRVNILCIGNNRIFLRFQDGKEVSLHSASLVFRPLKTPEQLAAEQRERAIDQMTEVIRGTFTWVEALGKLYDAGARLPE